ncbi:MAG: DUF4230 domain-containing protein [Lactovum sp.]
MSVRRIIRKVFTFKIYAWLLVLFLILFALVYFSGRKSNFSSKNTQTSTMIKYIEKTHQEVFLNVGLQKVISQEENTKIPWTDIGIPLSEKKALIVLNYEAKLGIKTAVKVEKTEDNHYTLKIPKYEVIGIALDKDQPYKLYDSSAELLSFSTANVDTGKLATDSLTMEQQKEYLESYQTEIDESVKAYYTSLFKTINPEIKLAFVFSK